MRAHGETIVIVAVLFAIPLAVMIAGGTFGQRCADVYDEASAAWERCVMRVAEGGPVWEENIDR